MSLEIDWPDLERRAIGIRLNAYAPYSSFHVGAALLVRSGAIFLGCNIENASFGLCLCAERTAVAHMITAGEQDPVALVVATRGPTAAAPCGMCRQTLAEFAQDLPIRLVVDGVPSATVDTTLAHLLPHAFRKDAL